VQALGLDQSAEVAALRVRALAESRLAQHDLARASIERALQCARRLRYDGLPLATLYEAQARVAIAAGVSEECLGALTRLHAILEHADAPALVNAYEALREESTKELALPALPGVMPDTHTSPTESSTMFTEIRTRLGAFNERHERAQHALELLLESSGAHSGGLFLLDAGGLFAAASIGREVAEEELLAIAQKHVDAELGAARADAVTVADLAISATTTATSVEEDARAVPILLTDGDERNPMLLGVALVATRQARVRSPRSELVQAISRCLKDAGDSLPMPLDA
jgi:hypothetical protein